MISDGIISLELIPIGLVLLLKQSLFYEPDWNKMRARSKSFMGRAGNCLNSAR